MSPQRRGQSDPSAVVVFDDACALCQASIAKLMRWDQRGRIECVAAASDDGQRLLAQVGRLADAEHTVVLVVPRGVADDDHVFVRSSAVLRSVALTGSWRRFFKVFLLVPRPLRDAAYDVVARNRSRLPASEGSGGERGLTCACTRRR